MPIDYLNADHERFFTPDPAKTSQQTLVVETPQGEREDADARMSIEELEARAFSEYSDESFYGDENDQEFAASRLTRIFTSIKVRFLHPKQNDGVWVLGIIILAGVILLVAFTAGFLYFKTHP